MASDKPTPGHCPRCLQSDAAYKVSTLYEYAFSTQTYQAHTPPPLGTNWASTIKTEEKVVSKKLAPPPRPNRPGLLGGTKDDPADKLMPPAVRNLQWTIAVGSMIAGIIIADILESFVYFCVVVAAGAMIMFYRRQPYRNQAMKNYENNLPKWHSAMEKWHRIYYCARDDIVFDPEHGSYAPANQTKAYVYE